MPHLSIEQLLEPLNAAQKSAVQQITGPLLIVAGPGSGKTRVITHRIAHMIQSGIASRKILALTFTNKAADELRNRLAVLAPDNLIWAGTFHRFCSRLLRVHAPMVGLQENFTIYDSGDAQKIVKQAIENTEVDLRHYAPKSVAGEISNVKNVSVTPEQFKPRPGNAMDNIVAKVYPEYQKLLQMSNGVDFDDLLSLTVELLRQNPELRSALDQRFEYVLVDEYQDTNIAQYHLVRLLNYDIQNLSVTGDPDQSIYGWRGANIGNILAFEKDYPDVKVVSLQQNYRSTKAILHVADQLIANNSRRKKKLLTTDNEQGAPVRLVAYGSPQEEAADIVNSIALSIEKGEFQPSDHAILYRTNYLSRSLEHALHSAGIPYQVVKGHEFYQRMEIKDVVAYLHLINNNSDGLAFERVVNTPARKIGKVTVARLRDYATVNRIPMLEAARNVNQIETIKSGAASKLKLFVALMDDLIGMATADVESIIKTVIDRTGYRDWLTMDGSEEGFERARNVDELIVAAAEFDSEHVDDPDGGGLERYLEQTALVSDTDAWEARSDYVTLMTLHAAKGLEFPSVYIVGVEDGILPHQRSCDDDKQIEEERRLMFVGITRAQKQLQLSRCSNRFRRGSYSPAIASRFLMELPRSEMQVFEPRSSAMTRQEIEQELSGRVSWASDDSMEEDLLADDAVEVDEYAAEGAERESSLQKRPVTAHTTPKPLPSMADMMTGAQLAQKQAQMSGGTRLEPDDYEVGLDVQHIDYGVGNVTRVEGVGKKKTATINFPQHGEKLFRVAFSDLRRVQRS